MFCAGKASCTWRCIGFILFQEVARRGYELTFTLSIDIRVVFFVVYDIGGSPFHCVSSAFPSSEPRLSPHSTFLLLPLQCLLWSSKQLNLTLSNGYQSDGCQR